jgi:hypothetical protein
MTDSTSAQSTVSNAVAATDQEVDLWWGGYDGRAMLPSFLVCGLLTLAIFGLGWLVWYQFADKGLRPHWIREGVYGLLVVVWFVQLGRWTSRVATTNYRLSSRRLFYLTGMTAHPMATLLSDIGDVTVEQNRWEHWLDLGCVRIRLTNGKDAVFLRGLHNPVSVAESIRQAASRMATPGHHFLADGCSTSQRAN